jgi:hypothetical protein
VIVSPAVVGWRRRDSAEVRMPERGAAVGSDLPVPSDRVHPAVAA